MTVIGEYILIALKPKPPQLIITEAPALDLVEVLEVSPDLDTPIKKGDTILVQMGKIINVGSSLIVNINSVKLYKDGNWRSSKVHK